MKKEIRNYNDKGQYYGYQKWYHEGNLYFRGKMKNGLAIHYFENHATKQTKYHIK